MEDHQAGALWELDQNRMIDIHTKKKTFGRRNTGTDRRTKQQGFERDLERNRGERATDGRSN